MGILKLCQHKSLMNRALQGARVFSSKSFVLHNLGKEAQRANRISDLALPWPAPGK